MIDPKGVALSHEAILSNVEASIVATDFNNADHLTN